MRTAGSPVEHVRAEIARVLESLGGSGPAGLVELRVRAAAHFARGGFPTPKSEDWRYTDLSVKHLSVPFRAVDSPAAPEAAERLLASHPLLAGARWRAVFVDGRLESRLTRLGDLPPGAAVRSFSGHPECARLFAETLREGAGPEDPVFAWINLALFRDGLSVELLEGTELPEPLHVVHLGWGPGDFPEAAYLRHRLILGRRTRACVVEHFLAREGKPFFTCALTEADLAEGAALDHCLVEDAAPDAHHAGRLVVRLGPRSRLSSFLFSAGAAFARHELKVSLAGEQASCSLAGLTLAAGRRHADVQTFVDHAVPGCSSRERFRGILAGESVAVFNGRVFVRPGAQKTDSRQENRNLLLSRTAKAHFKPQLEIYADDVKCTHGAVGGPLEGDALFYLRSRGLSASAAKRLLAAAFGLDVLGEAGPPPLREALRAEFEDWLAHEAGLGGAS